jgi:beta-lactamase class A
LRSRSSVPVLRGISIAFLSIAIVITIVALVGYSRTRNNYPTGMTIGGVPVGGVDPQIASQRVLQVYDSPIEVQYGDAVIQIDPSVVGFELDLDSMIAAADLARTGGSFWGGFWNYIWNRTPNPVEIPLSASLAEERLVDYLQNEISARYDEPPPRRSRSLAAQPSRPASPARAGHPARRAPDRGYPAFAEQPYGRAVLPTERGFTTDDPEPRKSPAAEHRGGQVRRRNRRIHARPANGQEIHFAMDRGELISVNPDVAFTSSSTVKIPIMVSYFIKYGTDALTENISNQILDMIRKSENPPADRLMTNLDSFRGPLVVTEDMRKIGLENTFLAGFFAVRRRPVRCWRGSPLQPTKGSM